MTTAVRPTSLPTPLPANTLTQQMLVKAALCLAEANDVYTTSGRRQDRLRGMTLAYLDVAGHFPGMIEYLGQAAELNRQRIQVQFPPNTFPHPMQTASVVSAFHNSRDREAFMAMLRQATSTLPYDRKWVLPKLEEFRTSLN